MSKPINDGGPAFPVPVAQPFGDGVCAIGGMSLRAYFAGQALAFYLTGVRPDAAWPAKQSVAEHCVQLADALIAKLEEKQ